MADFSALIQRIKDAVYENGVQAITGQILQDCLKDVVNTVNVAKQDGIYRVTVTVDNNTGVPSGTARMDDDTYTLELSFHNLKGEKGDKGDKGDTPVLTADSDGVIYSDGVMLTRVIKDTTDALTTRADSDHARAESDHARAETDHTDITRARLDAETATSEANYASLRANTAADNADAAREAIQSDLAAKQDVIPDLQQIRAGATDTVKYSTQSLTDAQKGQARANIGAADADEVSQLRSEILLMQMFWEVGSIGSTGRETTNANVHRSIYIPCSVGSVVDGFLYRVNVYDSEMNHLAQVGTSYEGNTRVQLTINTPGAAYIRIVIRNAQIFKALTLDSVSVYSLPLKHFMYISSASSTATGEILPIIDKMFASVFTPGGIKSTTGQDEANAYLHRSAFFVCPTNGVLTGYIYRVFVYDDNFTYLGQEGTSYLGNSVVNHTITTANAAFVRVTVYNARITEQFFVDGKNSFDSVAVVSGSEELHQHITDFNNPHRVTLTQLGGVGGIKLDGTPAQNVDGYALVPAATPLSPGLMSAADKQRLDNIIPGGTINISGSGITKNAAAFGFLPTNDGDTNAANMQDCLDGGGLIIVDVPGTYELSKSLLLDSNTELIFGAGVFIQLVAALQGQNVRIPFLNRGALLGQQNTNIIIRGLNLNAGNFGGGTDISILGQRGYIGLCGVRDVVLENIHITSSGQWYNIHIQEFENIRLSNIRVESTKDGIHLGVGKNFVIRDCFFTTEDDAIALNAVDYFTGTREYGWIENGVIENIHFGKAPNGEIGRGLYCLGGAWQNWQNGNQYQTYGDIVANPNVGAVYVTAGAFVQPAQFLTSTSEPNHLSGTQTYPDGLTWVRLDNAAAILNGGVRNITARNLWYDGQNTPVSFNVEESAYCRSVYPNTPLPFFENITIENINMAEYGGGYYLFSVVPFRSVKFLNCEYKPSLNGVQVAKRTNELVTSDKNSVLFVGTTWNFNQNNTLNLLNNSAGRTIDLKIIGSVEEDMSGGTPKVIGSSTMNITSDIIIQNT